MSNIKKIKKNRKAILTGEIGALLHDIGKLHPNFIGSKSIENTPNSFSHANIDGFLKTELINLIKAFETLKIANKPIRVYDIITKHHSNGILRECDRKDSADDKGIVRKKQPIKNTIISSPFGYPKEKIDLNCLQTRFDDLQNNLIKIFKNYISGVVNLSHFRRTLMDNLQVFSHGLGETRIPSNDVTLWDHSYSTASLFKSALASMACETNDNKQQVKWRIFGIFWDGVDFVNNGKKITEVKARNDTIEDIKRKLKEKFEDEIPIGNIIYEDINGICFTFPEFDQAKELAKQCAEKALKIILKESKDELWPFFTLSKASKTLTIIASALEFASKKRRIPRMTPTLFVEKNAKYYFKNPKIATLGEGQDVCPVCKIRPKSEKEERCETCEERRKGRLEQWLSNRQETIWIDEVADKNNKIALIALNFDLDKWLDGTMIGTIYSQTFEDWKHSKKWKNDIPSPEATKDYVHKITRKILKFINSDKSKAAKLLDTFFEDINVKKGNNLDTHLSNIEERIQTPPNSKSLATYLFTQNASPSRLYRIWKETEEFFDLIINEIKNKIYHHKWKRINFSINPQELEDNLKDEYKDIKKIEKVPLIIKIKGLNPESLLVFHNRNGEFYTIESLEKFKFNDKIGEEAVKKAIKRGINYLALEDKPDENLLNKNKRIEAKIAKKHEEYYPLIEINKFPLSLRFIAPALDSMKIIEMITRLYNKRFEKSIGKVPLDVKLLVAKRKFPLYILLDAEKRMLEDEEFKKQTPMNPWWEPDRAEEHYGFYPTKPINGEKYTLDDLSPLSKGKIFYLYPGYFDFELLSATTNRYNIYYEGEKRGHEDHRLFSGRPYYFYQIPQIIELWDILSNNLSSSQINFIEETLTSKLREWRNVKDKNKQNIFRKFAEATLKNAFGDKWDKLRDETKIFLISSALNRLLLDTINLFEHVTKRGA